MVRPTICPTMGRLRMLLAATLASCLNERWARLLGGEPSLRYVKPRMAYTPTLQKRMDQPNR